jgi:acetyl esterase/lipase
MLTSAICQVGAAKYRLMRKQGLTPLPAATLVPTATNLSVQSRDPGREIPCRVLSPQHAQPRGLFLHIHGGGWVLNDEASQDVYLQDIADRCGLLCLSVGYRVAPEHPYPAAPDDCFDVASWLTANARERFGTDLAFIGGESAGANLAVVTVLRLFRSSLQEHASLRLKGLLLHYGSYSMRWLPGPKLFRRKPTLILDEEMMDNFREAYVPGMKDNEQQLTSPDVSPFYADLTGLNLPPALFTVGTEDCLLEDSVFMSTRWMIAGGEAILKIYPGSPHGFILFAPEKHTNAGTALHDLKTFIDMQFSPETAVESGTLCVDC